MTAILSSQWAKNAFKTALCVASAVVLPQLFHAIGGPGLGAMLLPMQIPVLVAGFRFGRWVGFLTGLLSPLVSFALSGMPLLTLLPFMVLELGAYGLTAGLLSRTQFPKPMQLLLTLMSGRVLRALALVLWGGALSWTAILGFIPAGALGILLQVVLFPLYFYRHD